MGRAPKRSNVSSDSSMRSRTQVDTTTPQALAPLPEDTSPSPSSSTCMSVAGQSSAGQRRKRGPTTGKRTRQRMRMDHNGGRLNVYVTEEFRDFCGINALPAVNELGLQIRRHVRKDNFYHTWKLIPEDQKDAIIQGFRDIFEVTEDGIEWTPLVEAVVQFKARERYKDWKCAMSRYYEKVKDEGKDPYQHPYQAKNEGTTLEEWRFMIDRIFKDPAWQARKKAGKDNRNKHVKGFNLRSRLNCMGSSSFAAAITKERDKPNGKVLDFPERYRISKTMRDGGWVDPQCEELHARMLVYQKEAIDSRNAEPTDEEYSTTFLGEARYYFRGLGVQKPSNKSSNSSSACQALQQVKSQLESLRAEQQIEREEAQRKWEEVQRRHDEEQRRRDEEREEERLRYEALQAELSEFRAFMMSQRQGRDSPPKKRQGRDSTQKKRQGTR